MVVSKESKKYYENIGATNVEVIRNYPIRDEVENVSITDLECSSIVFTYIGNDITRMEPSMYRDMRAFWRMFKSIYDKTRRVKIIVIGDKKLISNEMVQSIGYVKHVEMYKYITKSHYGVLAWAPSPFHKYCNPNKPYIYAHGGSIPIITSSLTDVVDDLGKYSVLIPCDNFEEELKNKMKELLTYDCSEINKLRRQLLNYARLNLLWDKQEYKIFKLLSKA